MSDIDKKQEREREKLINLLIDRGNNSNQGYIKFKVIAWHITVSGSYFIKRVFDITLALIFTLFFLPLFILTAILIKLESPGPILFRQIRVGKNGCHFLFYKFRSMRIDAEEIKNGFYWIFLSLSRLKNFAIL